MFDLGSVIATPRRTYRAAYWTAALACLLALGGCAGGSGSSGFDLRALEDQSIQRALDTGMCQSSEGLTICGADEGPTPIPTPTATTPTPTAVATATTTVPILATVTPSAPIRATPTTTPPARPSATPTATAVPPPPNVETNLDGTSVFTCIPLPANEAVCSFDFLFMPRGIPSGAEYRVAVRTTMPLSDWRIFPAPAVSGPADAPSFDQGLNLSVSQSGDVTYQFAVLVFVSPAGTVPDTVHRLAESGADFAFVTQELTTDNGQ